MRTRLIYMAILGFVLVAGTAGGTMYYLWKEAKFASGGQTSQAVLKFYDDVNAVAEKARRRYDTLGYQRESEYVTHLERIDAMLAGRPGTPPPRRAFGKAQASGGGTPKGADAAKGGGAPKAKG